MDAMSYMEKIASINDGSFGVKIASDIIYRTNEKLAALFAPIDTAQSIARFKQIFSQASPQQAATIASRFRQLGNQNMSKVVSRTPAVVIPVTQPPAKLIPQLAHQQVPTNSNMQYYSRGARTRTTDPYAQVRR